MAKWIGQAPFRANKQPSHPKRDTAAARPKKKKGRTKKSEAKHVDLCAANLGGHMLKKFGNTCDATSKKLESIAPARCTGAPTSIWQSTLNEFITLGALVGRGHTQKMNQTALWCTSCGAFEGPFGSSAKAPLAQ